MNIVLAEWLFKEQTLGTYTSRFGFNIFKKKKDLCQNIKHLWNGQLQKVSEMHSFHFSWSETFYHIRGNSNF